MVVMVLIEGDDGQRPLGPPGRRAHDGAKLPGQEIVPGPDPAALHVGAVIGAHPGEAWRAGRAGQVGPQRLQRDHVSGAVGGPVADVGEVRHRQVVVPVVLVHRVVARAGRALQVALPGLVRRVHEVADVAGMDRVVRVLLQRVVQRDAERAAAGQGEIVAVARVLRSEEVGEHTGLGQQAVEERGLPRIADDRLVALVLEVKEEHVLVARDAGPRRGERRRAADRGGDAEPQVIGDGPVIAHERRVRPVDVGQRCGQDQRDPGAGRPRRQRARRHPAGQPAFPPAPAGRADRAPAEHPPGRGQERHPHGGPAPGGAAEPRRQPVSGAGGQGMASRRPQRDLLPQPCRAARAAREQVPAAHGRPAPGARESRRAVPHDSRQAAGHPPARDRDGVPALRGHIARLRARIEQQVGPGPGDRPGQRPARPEPDARWLTRPAPEAAGPARPARETACPAVARAIGAEPTTSAPAQHISAAGTAT